MNIGIISDTHDNIALCQRALQRFQELQVSLIIHCGDICQPSTVELFRVIPTHFVLGNNDDERELVPAIAGIGGHCHGLIGELTLAHKNLAWVHGHLDSDFRTIKRSGKYDYLFFGHSHRAEYYQFGSTTVINPGALRSVRRKTCGTLNLDSDHWNEIILDEI